MENNWKIGDDIYLKDNGEKYYGRIVGFKDNGRTVLATFGTDEPLPHKRSSLTNLSAKKLSLADNTNKMKKLMDGIDTNIVYGTFYTGNYPPQKVYDNGKIKNLKNTIRNAKRLLAVIEKQSKESVNEIFGYKIYR